MSRYAIAKVAEFEHPARPGRIVRSPVLVHYLFDSQKRALGFAAFHIDAASTWCLCRLDDGFDALSLAVDTEVVLLDDSRLGATVTASDRLKFRAAKLRFGFAADVETGVTYKDVLNAVGRELGSGFDVEAWR